MIKIGIIGKGFVGSAVENGFKNNKNFDPELYIFDKNEQLLTHSLSETINCADLIFISVPTPSNINGSINFDILENLLTEINLKQTNKGIILIRSTVTPGTCDYFQNKFQNIDIVFNPEFLTERNANKDFLNQDRIILGGDSNNTKKVAEIFQLRFPEVPIIKTDFKTAELIKYMNNCFFSTKVSFLNEMKIVASKIDANWDDAINGFTLDSRVGKSHNDVPGHDGKLGFGGSCFPKDIRAFIYFMKELDLDPLILKAVWSVNLDVRPEKDWEKLKGRSILDNN
ncbi:hypothetical protein N9C34_00605 [Candidatus Marinimicrobia bacterium]|nr:hypothetical protein [Candidatus Neomarinimicrobiota bacterium]